MKQLLKQIILIGGLAALIFHFSLIVIYNVSPGKYSNFYVYPYFHQNWNLFVPPPDSNYQLLIKDEKGGTDILSELIVNHQSNRLAGNEALLLALTNSIHYFEKTALENNFINGKVENNYNFAIIEKTVNAYFANKKIKHPPFKLILIVSPLNLEAKRVYYN